MEKQGVELVQNVSRNDMGLIRVGDEALDGVAFLMEAFFELEATNSPESRKAQQRDFKLFLDFMVAEVGNDERIRWSPRLSSDFRKYLQTIHTGSGEAKKRRWSDRTVNRVLTHLKRLSKWIHKYRPFPLGDPMQSLKSIPLSNHMEIERAITPDERRRILDAADLLPAIGGRSKDRHRYKKMGEDGQLIRPQRKGVRPWRNRAIIYTLIETGMRRAGVIHIQINDIDFQKRLVPTLEKGGIKNPYSISREGIAAIQRYILKERSSDNEQWNSSALFLPASTVANGKEALSVKAVNRIWTEVCSMAGVEDRTPHSARHGMGKFLAKEKGIEYVKRQLGHQNLASSVAYARPTNQELQDTLDGRN